MNYTGIFDDPSGIAGYMMETFSGMQPYFWVLFFGGIIGYIYLSMQSITAAIIAILLTFGLWGAVNFPGISLFNDVPLFNQFLYIITLVGLTALVGGFIMKKRS